jgi:cell shape-determining protein MreC
METITFEQKVLGVLSSMQKEMSVMKHDVEYIRKQMSETYLTDEEEQLLEEALKHEKEGKLISLNEMKKQLGIK